jgi:hypothetical protein
MAGSPGLSATSRRGPAGISGTSRHACVGRLRADTHLSNSARGRPTRVHKGDVPGADRGSSAANREGEEGVRRTRRAYGFLGPFLLWLDRGRGLEGARSRRSRTKVCAAMERQTRRERAARIRSFPSINDRKGDPKLGSDA